MSILGDLLESIVGRPGRAARGIQTLVFKHGLGDAANFAHILAMYVRRGHRFRIASQRDERGEIVFKAVAETVPFDTPGEKFPWIDGERFPTGPLPQPWTYNKLAINLSLPPLPDIGTPEQLWRELCETRVSIGPVLSATGAQDAARAATRGLPRPIVLLHPRGYSYQDLKSLSPEQALSTAERVQERTGGSVLVLDHYEDLPQPRRAGVALVQRITVPYLFGLLLESDLIIGIDSGPLHASRLTDIKSIGLWPDGREAAPEELKAWVDGYIFPSRFSLPTPGRINLVAARLAPLVTQLEPEWGARTSALSPEEIADTAVELLAGA